MEDPARRLARNERTGLPWPLPALHILIVQGIAGKAVTVELRNEIARHN